MDWLWTWGGASFGYRDGDALWTHDGRHVGRFPGQEVYARSGTYLGELMRSNRLITHPARARRLHRSFTPFADRAAAIRYADCTGHALPAGYADFPAPEAGR